MPSLLTDHLATRARSLDFATLGLLLPNPDPILKAQGKDIRVYRGLTHDALIGGCIRRRKSAVKALDWGLDKGQAASRVAKAVTAMIEALDVERIMGQMMEATLYGYQPMEITWAKVGGQILPTDVQAKPPEWFCFDADANLRFKTRESPLFGEELPERKFLLPRQDPTYQNPYGFPDLSMCYWPLLFKKGGLKFWLAFTEKFGSAFAVGKLPRSATDTERATLLDSLDALMVNGVATIPDDGAVELVEMAGKMASADLYEKLVNHCRGEIAIALLGQNQTTEASANKASSVSGLEVTKHLRDGDAEIVSAAFNQLIRWTCELNWGGTEAPVFSQWDQEAQDTLLAGRDKSNYDSGARFTNAYFERAYGYEAGDLMEPPPVLGLNAALPGAQAGAAGMPLDPKAAKSAKADAAQFAERVVQRVPQVTLPDPTLDATNTLMQAAAPAWSTMVGHLQGLVDRATSLPELQQAMVASYAELDTDELVKLMGAAMALAELKGLDDVRREVRGTIIPANVAQFAEPDPQASANATQTAAGIAAIGAGVVAMGAAMQSLADRPAAPAPAPASTTLSFADMPAPTVQVDVHNTYQLPEQPAPTVINQVQPGEVVVNNVHPAKATQTVDRDEAGEILSTTTTYHPKD